LNLASGMLNGSTLAESDADYIYMFFWVLFLTGWIPCGLIGMVLFAVGLGKSVRNNDNFNKNSCRTFVLR
jgi:hypothetical protein